MFYQDSQLTIHNGDALAVLREMESESVQCCVTSPPYYGLRNYNCDGQIGMEETPELFITKLVDVFREVRRVLKDDGTLWVNIGDSYANDSKWGGSSGGKHVKGLHGETGIGRGRKFTGLKSKDLVGIPWMLAFALRADGWYLRQDIIWAKPNPMPESVTDRCTKSHEYIFLLSKSARYFYNADAIKEPIKDVSVARLLRGVSDENKLVDGAPGQSPHAVHQPRKAIKFDGNNLCPDTRLQSGKEWSPKMAGGGSKVKGHSGYFDKDGNPLCGVMANKKSVWSVTTRGYKDAHFATFPPALIEPCILAGSRPAGKRCDCAEVIATPTGEGEITDPTMNTGRAGMNRPRRPNEGTRPITRRVQRGEAEQMKQSSNREQMREICGLAFDHYIRTDTSGARPLPESIRQDFLARGWLVAVRHCECPIEAADVVLDPFGGSGTTAQVANKFGRKAVLIELNPEYCELAMKRNCQKTLFAAAE